MSANSIAARAMTQLGTPFRMRGRTPGIALDCIGLALAALGPLAKTNLPCPNYAMRGDYRSIVCSYFAELPFRALAEGEAACDGDILLASPAPSQLHLLVTANGGWVHAHAGLGRVVFTPEWPNWPILNRWRFTGD
ncbi:MAG: peptidoglycan endopeptidase [Sphingorhabdus sp.]|uniref:peptidoglycan endopeptidase n=1 Tax=Sphingorhabdus sp. TaxID=1902408 RepID=UPI003CBCC964